MSKEIIEPHIIGGDGGVIDVYEYFRKNIELENYGKHYLLVFQSFPISL